MSSRFVLQRVGPAGPVIRSAHLGQDPPEASLIAEWPAGTIRDSFLVIKNEY